MIRAPQTLTLDALEWFAFTYGGTIEPRPGGRYVLVGAVIDGRRTDLGHGVPVSREWKPGDVAMVKQLDGRERRAVVGTYRGAAFAPPHFTYANGGYDDVAGKARDARPLVVIDPEDRAQVERLLGVWRTEYRHDQRDLINGGQADALQAALREFADPKPEEPTGLGAVVEDANADLWVHSCQGGRAQWMRRNNPSAWREWSEIDAVRVLSEGVQS